MPIEQNSELLNNCAVAIHDDRAKICHSLLLGCLGVDNQIIVFFNYAFLALYEIGF